MMKVLFSLHLFLATTNNTNSHTYLDAKRLVRIGLEYPFRQFVLFGLAFLEMGRVGYFFGAYYFFSASAAHSVRSPSLLIDRLT